MRLLNEINEMALKLMKHEFQYNGSSYTMSELDWGFQFNNNKRRLGLCSNKTGNKMIYLSKWLIENTENGIDTWKNTMLHEIAHAIDWEIRKKSDHSYRWENIALAIGCNGRRTSIVKYKVDTLKTKYTLVCDNCGKTYPSHKLKRRKSSCTVCGNGKYNEKYLLRQIKNY